MHWTSPEEDDLYLKVYEPRSPKLVVVKSRISHASWNARVDAAKKDAKVLDRIAKLVGRGESLNKAIREIVPESRRSWVVRNWRAYQRDGLEALIDARLPREQKLSPLCGPIIEAARLANPKVKVDEVLEILQGQRVGALPSRSNIEKHFRRADDRRRYAKSKQAADEEVVELPFAGGELLLAAETETAGMAALADELVSMGEDAKEASGKRRPKRDIGLRDAKGRFTAKYNRARRRKCGEQVASYLRPAEEKGKGRVPSWPRFVRERRESLESKIRMLTLGWMVSTTKGWDALRAPEVAGLEPLTGFAYMPSTLAKLTSALAINGAGQRLLQTVGDRWHEVCQQHWGEAGAMAALYVDNHVKEVWTSLYTRSGKVSHLSRVMPCITTTYAHTGAGTPLVASVHSGGAPLAPRLVELVAEIEDQLPESVRRAVIIDAEGSTFDILEAFSKAKRVIVTPLRPSRAPGLELHYTAGSYFRPYRDNDELRVAQAVLTHKSTERTLELGALLVRREHRESDTVLLTTGLGLGMEGRELADLYFARWSIQENMFKDAGAVQLNEHRGNSSRIVTNVAVATELERLESRAKQQDAKLNALKDAVDSLQVEELDARRKTKRSSGKLVTRRARVDALIAQGRVDGRAFSRATIEQQEALSKAESDREAHERVSTALEANRTETAKLEASLKKIAKRRTKLEPQRAIRELDVELDRVLTATKLTASLLLTFAIREYLPSFPMTPQTFISRVLPLRGRRVLREDTEVVSFYENSRDPEVNEALRDACIRLNRRQLQRDGRCLRYTVESPDSVV